MKLATVIGNRPQFIKAAALSPVLVDSGIEEGIIHTGQHYDDNLSGIFAREYGLSDLISLGVSSGERTPRLGKMMTKLEPALIDAEPDAVLVYGDTDSTLAGALIATKLRLRVIHVEAGLRCREETPEGLVRIAVDSLAHLNMAPTLTSLLNLKAEGLGESAHLVGDVMYDLWVKQPSPELLTQSGHGLVTMHRESNSNFESLAELILTLNQIREVEWLWPMHPKIKELLEKSPPIEMGGNIHVMNPVSHSLTTQLIREARLVVTDSGGIQKEAFWSRVPSVVLRTDTEWSEIVYAGWSKLSPLHTDCPLRKDIEQMLSIDRYSLPKPSSVHGEGKACELIASILGRRI